MRVESIWKIYLMGLGILIGAIILNFIANVLGIQTWYGFLNNIASEGIKNSFKQSNLLSIIFMFLIYPFVLGLIGYSIFRSLF